MKSMIIALAFATALASCNSNEKIKADALKQVKDSLRLDSFNRAEAKEVEIAKEKELALASQSAAASKSSSRRTYVKGESETYTNAAPAKKGWSKAAKGAAIGVGAGAVTGIIVDKKDGRGAAVGAVVGGTTGYIIGRSKDKKDGRVQ
ncbi:MAG TPA: YMGG-like glycine zipper-containing protein [Pedobacter sp.]|jgi:hypothetical protein